jgi:hypothetical protein
MAEITTAFMMPFQFKQPLNITGGPTNIAYYEIVAVDTYGTNTRQIPVAVPAVPPSTPENPYWFIISFARTNSPTGLSIDSPINLLKTVRVALNGGITLPGNYEVALMPTGLVGIYNAAPSPATLTFNSSELAYALGFTSVGPHTVPGSNWLYSDYQPTHCLFSYAREEDTGWQSKGQIYAVADLPDGTVYGWGNGSARFTRKCNLKYHPKDVDSVTGILSNITPAFPPTSGTDILGNALNLQWKYPTVVPTHRPPFTVHNFLNAAISLGQGTIIAACFGNFQSNMNAPAFDPALKFERVSLSAESIRAEHFSLSIPNYDKFRNVDNITMNFYDHSQRVV